jgi:uncharacterized protein YggU (UPF0235/DUF167 family)
VRFAVRVKPGARRDTVGGSCAGGGSGVGGGSCMGAALLVAVRAPAQEGKANEAVRRALAKAFGVPRSAVRIVTGERGRDKLVELAPAPPGAGALLASLLAASG